ncbi:hypothetical protein [Trinickia mobilis]|uniref:hypothetical protein n=1 Tax=Trinickia mobilis TaxID=2816356 RepID=UPI001A8ED6ED|nr:hypothetical protein [Trinickia mobilis]
MTPKEFVAHLKADVVDENVAAYRDLFASTSVGDASDPYWKRAQTLFDSFSPDQKSIFFEIIRQISVDTVSNVLGIVDVVNTFPGVAAEFELVCDSQQKLSGDLQSLFLEEEERA